MKEKLWVEKYRPSTINDYIFQNPSHEKAFREMLNQKHIPHLLLSGIQGTGKTTLARILINSLGLDESDKLVINASDENSVDVIRDKIKAFVTSYAFSEYKVVLLEEADYITLNGQAVMRGLMEDYADNARFVLTCNFKHRILDAIRSRCQQFTFKAPSKDDIAEYVANIIVSEKITSTSSNIIEELYRYIDVYYPDIRHIVTAIQQNSIGGELASLSRTSDDDISYKHQLLDLMRIDDWTTIRQLVCDQVSKEEWEDVYRFLYQNIEKSPTFANRDKWEQAICVLAYHLNLNTSVADPEINGAAMFIKISQLCNRD